MFLSLFLTCFTTLMLATVLLLMLGHRVKVAFRLFGLLMTAGLAILGGEVAATVWRLPSRHVEQAELLIIGLGFVLALLRPRWNPIGQAFYAAFLASALSYLGFAAYITVDGGLSVVGSIASGILLLFEFLACSWPARSPSKASTAVSNAVGPDLPEARSLASTARLTADRRLQRTPGHADRDHQVGAGPGLPELRDRRHRQQHRGPGGLAAGRTVLPRRAARPVRSRRQPLRLQGRRAEPGAQRVHGPRRRAGRRRGRRLPGRSGLPQGRRGVFHRPGPGVPPDPAGLPRVPGQHVSHGVLRRVRVLLRHLDAVPERPKLDHLRRDHGPASAVDPGEARRVGRMDDHRGRRGFAAHAEDGLLGPVHRQAVRARDHAADVRLVQEPAVPMVLRRDADPAPALARPDAMEPGPGELPDVRPAHGLPPGRAAVAERLDLSRIHHGAAGHRGTALDEGPGRDSTAAGRGRSAAQRADRLRSPARAVGAQARMQIGTKRAVLAFMTWLSLSWTVALACLQGLLRKEGVFMRTPKMAERGGLFSALWAARTETVLAAGLWGVGVLTVLHGVATPFLLTLFAWQGAVYATAPYMSWLNQHSVLTGELERRRRTEQLRERKAPYGRYLAGLLASAAIGTVIVALLVLGGAHPGTHPKNPFHVTHRAANDKGPLGNLIGGGPVAPAPSPTPSQTPSVTPSPTVSPSPSPTVSLSP